jgi:hypothetical protein
LKNEFVNTPLEQQLAKINHCKASRAYTKTDPFSDRKGFKMSRAGALWRFTMNHRKR